GRYSIMSRLPILESRVIIARDGVEIAYVQFDASASLGRNLTIYLVDLPSELRVPRADQARRVRAWLDDTDAPTPDLVLGDFNTPRDSHSLELLFPEFHHAFDDGGTGYGSSFHRSFPLYHIDHILLSNMLRAESYALVNPEIGRHLIQQAMISSQKSSIEPARD
ncbi:MAG: hypothetical protein O7G85_01915, partial [Planctomycetota bacterium]|nr:hypothetical protein [Planctomycetota bacterium]